MSLILAGDIGGTKTRLRILKTEDYIGQFVPKQTVIHEKKYCSRDYPDLSPLVKSFLEECWQLDGKTYPIDKACFGIAGPVVRETCELTNLSWSLGSDRLARELSIPTIKLINDFTAVGYGLLGLEADDLYDLQYIKPDLNTPIALLGAGTGLGQGFLTPLPGGGYQVFGSEGSHADFAPRSAIEYDLLNYLLEKLELERLSVERVVSGNGIINIYRFLRDRYPQKESPAMNEYFQAWFNQQGQPHPTIDLAGKISKSAMQEKDPLCQETMKIFMSAYGAEAGNLALKILPYGGLYIAGGIAPKIISLFTEEDFMSSFLAKGRLRPVLEKIPVKIVLNSQVGLIGAGLCAGLSR
ncbi:MAG: Glucokinase [Chroococcopsis gigantea SAG 12.99]|jgi:glucokinase|nr:glucokinase [Chlorogloea purpurea SAG 13.99]MDV2999879.1 Glucokinase [Chroococcopsis gigantea SAG 12.99]